MELKMTAQEAKEFLEKTEEIRENLIILGVKYVQKTSAPWVHYSSKDMNWQIIKLRKNSFCLKNKYVDGNVSEDRIFDIPYTVIDDFDGAVNTYLNKVIKDYNKWKERREK